MSNHLLIYGAGTYGKIIYHDIKQFGMGLEVAAFVMDEKYIANRTQYGLPVVSFEDVEEKYPPNECPQI